MIAEPPVLVGGVQFSVTVAGPGVAVSPGAPGSVVVIWSATMSLAAQVRPELAQVILLVLSSYMPSLSLNAVLA